MSTPRLLYVLPKPDFFTEGGRGRVTHALGICEGFLENGWDVTVISGPGADRHWFSPPGLSAIGVPEDVCRARNLSPFDQLVWLRSFHHAFRTEVDREHYSVILVRYSLRWLPWLGWLGGVINRLGIPSVMEVNSFGFHRAKGRLPGLVSRALLGMEISAAAGYNLIYVVSPELEDLVNTRGHSGPVATVPNGVSTRLLTVLTRNRNSDRKRRMPSRCVYFGSFHSYYDFEILLTAFRTLRSERSDIELHLHGTGHEDDRISSLSRSMDGIHLHGRYEITELMEWLDPDRDILVLPPKEKCDMPLSGGLSTKLFEYMAMGLPVIASKQVDGILEHRENALLYTTRSPQHLARLIAELVDDPDSARKMAQKVRRTAHNEHTWRIRCKKLIDAFSSAFRLVIMEPSQDRKNQVRERGSAMKSSSGH